MKSKSEKKQYPDPWEHSTYQTGSTTPPKKHSPLVAILLVLVIFLTGLSSILGLLNFKMFSAFYEEQQTEIPLSIENDTDLEDQTQLEQTISSNMDNKIIGISGDPVTPVYQQHFGLPEGLFITYVEEGTSAHRQGIREGDVLISLGDRKITDENQIQTFLEGCAIGDTFHALVYRHDTNRQITVELTVEEASS